MRLSTIHIEFLPEPLKPPTASALAALATLACAVATAALGVSKQHRRILWLHDAVGYARNEVETNGGLSPDAIHTCISRVLCTKCS